MFKNKKGFTIIELSVIVIIIAILSAIVYPQYIVLKEKAPVAEVLENIEIIRAKQEYMLVFEGAYTESFTTLDAGIQGLVAAGNPEILATSKFTYTLSSYTVTANRNNTMDYTVTLTSYEVPTMACTCPSPIQDDCTKVCNNFDNTVGN